MVALGAVTRNLKNATLKIQDAGAAHTLTVPIEEGDLTWTETPPEAIVVLNRGVLSHYATGQDNAVTFSFTAKYVSLAGLTASPLVPSVYEALKGTGNASTWTSTESCGPFCFDLVWTLTSPCVAAAGDEDETVTFGDCHADSIVVTEGAEYNTIAVSGKALITAPTAVRS